MQLLVNNNMKYSRKNLITKTAFKMSQKVKENIGVTVFPVVERVNLGSRHNDEGYATWKMYKSDQTMIGSNQPVKEFLLKKTTIVELPDDLIGLNSFIYAQITK